MAQARTAKDTLDHDFLDTRSRILDVAAALDRLDRGDGAQAAGDDERLAKLLKAIEILTDGKPDRARRVQLAFSLAFDDGWRSG